MTPVQPYSRTQKLVILMSRRGRGISPLLILLILAIPVAFVTFVLPAAGPTPVWYVVAVDTTLASIFLFWRLIVLTGNALRHMRARPNIARMLAGDYLLHWHYDPEMWQRFAESEYRRDRDISRSFVTLRQGAIGSVLFGGFVACAMLAVNITETAKAGGKAPYSADFLLLCIAIAFALPMAVILLQMFNLYLGDRHSDRQRRKRVPEIYLNRQGIYGLPGGYMVLPAKSTKIRVEPGELSVLKVEVTRTIYSKNGAFPQIKVERIFIPRDQLPEAQGIGGYFG